MKTLAPTMHLTHEGSESRDGGHPTSRVARDAGRDSTQAASLPGRCRPQPRLSLPQQGTVEDSLSPWCDTAGSSEGPLPAPKQI